MDKFWILDSVSYTMANIK